MTIKIGNSSIKRIQLGSNTVKSAYLGSKLVYGSAITNVPSEPSTEIDPTYNYYVFDTSLDKDGTTVTLTMSAFTSIGGRTIKVMGTLGDITGDMHDNIIKITEFGKAPEIIDLGIEKKDFAGHGGGDMMLIDEFISLLEGKEVNNTVTTLEVSVESHLVALAAEESRLEGGAPQLIAPLRG